jgi:hypothetical protein
MYVGQCLPSSTDVQFIADNLNIGYEVIANYNSSISSTVSIGRITLKNAAASGSISYGNWEIYFTALRNYTSHDSRQFQACILMLFIQQNYG